MHQRISGLAIAGILAMMMAVPLRTAHADSIGVSFFNNFTNATLGPGVSAGVVPQTNFNNVSGAAGTSGALNNNNGASTTATVTTTAQSRGSYTSAPTDGNDLLNNGFSDSNLGVPIMVTLNNIPYSSYDLYVYNLGQNGANQQTTLGTTSFYSTSPDPNGAGYLDGNGGTAYTYTQATSTNAASPTFGANYVLFSGLTGNTQSFNVTGLNSNSRIGGFQVVQTVMATPEPETWAMMALGVGSLAVFGWRRKRGAGETSVAVAGLAM